MSGDVDGACPGDHGGVIVRVGVDDGDGDGVKGDGVLHGHEVDAEGVICWK